jgi:hypothetical protein
MSIRGLAADTSTKVEGLPLRRITAAVGASLAARPRRGGAKRPRASLRSLVPAVAAVLAVASSGPSAPASPHPRSVTFFDHHGPVLRAMQLYPIYWGSAWKAERAPSPTADQLTTAMRTMLAGSYLNGLAQYRGIGHGFVRGSAVITMSDPPHSFTEEQVRTFINSQLDAGAVPQPDADNQTVYIVIVPTGATSADSGFVGKHDYYVRQGRRIHYVWAADSGRLASATRILSHEIVETATDPEGSGFRGVGGACSQDGWCEIADVCTATSVLDGVTVWPYWSNQARGCVVPVLRHPRLLGKQPEIGRRPARPTAA